MSSSSQKGRKRAETLFGVEVARWTDQQTTADWLGVSTRTVQRLERKGMPNRGSGSGKEYPWPHVSVWHSEYAVEVALRGACYRLDIEDAFERDREFWARLEGRSDAGGRR